MRVDRGSLQVCFFRALPKKTVLCHPQTMVCACSYIFPFNFCRIVFYMFTI